MADILLPAGGLPLTIFAGIPSPFLHSVLEEAKRHYQHQGGYSLRRIEALSGLRGAQYRTHIINQTLKSVTQYVVQKRVNKKDEQQYSPSHISIVFLESNIDHENDLLLRSFFPFAQCVKIACIEIPWAEIALEDLLALFFQAVENMPQWGTFQNMACWALPIQNFQCPGPQNLQAICLQRMYNTPDEPPLTKSVIEHRTCSSGNRNECPKCPNRGREVPSDERGICFIRGTHGKARAPEERGDVKILLDSLYRFGYPLDDSVHFDAQFPKGKQIQEETFDCVINGLVPAKNSGRRAYVNIYPDDFVRVPLKKK